MSFPYFEFKIRLIRLELSFPEQKLLYSNKQPTDHQSGVITIGVFSKWSRTFIEFSEFREFRESEESLKHELGSSEESLKHELGSV